MSSSTVHEVVITQPGVYEDLDVDVYHADPVPGGSLSSSEARKLLPPSCPARFRYEQANPPQTKPAYEIGTAAHKLVLGDGPELELVIAADWRTASAREQAEKARAAGAVPLLPADYERVHAMADALREHPVAAALFDPTAGRPEQSLFWQDEHSDVWRRARLDWLPDPDSGRDRLIVPDYKTSRSADLRSIEKAVHSYGYHQQAAWYLDGIRALGLDDDPAFVFVFQEKLRPYLVTVVELDTVALRVGSDLNRRAIDIYRHCRDTDHWPGYADDIELVTLPPWATRNLQETPR